MKNKTYRPNAYWMRGALLTVERSKDEYIGSVYGAVAGTRGRGIREAEGGKVQGLHNHHARGAQAERVVKPRLDVVRRDRFLPAKHRTHID